MQVLRRDAERLYVTSDALTRATDEPELEVGKAYYRERFGHAWGDFPGAEKHYARALTIPLFPAMSDDEVGRVIEAVRGALGR